MQFLLRYSQNQINRILAVFFALTYVNHGCTKPLNGHWNLGTVLFQQQWCQFSSSSTSACQKVLDVQEVKWGAFFALVDPFIQGTAPKYSSTKHKKLSRRKKKSSIFATFGVPLSCKLSSGQKYAKNRSSRTLMTGFLQGHSVILDLLCVRCVMVWCMWDDFALVPDYKKKSPTIKC